MAESFKSKISLGNKVPKRLQKSQRDFSQSNSYESSTRKKQEDVFFVGVKEPLEVRRMVLEASKEALQSLQQYEKFKEVRIEKTKEILRLKKILKELDNLMVKLKTELPSTSSRIKPAKKEVKKEKKAAHKSKPVKKAAEKVKKKAKNKTEVEKLESELSDIEERLGKVD